MWSRGYIQLYQAIFYRLALNCGKKKFNYRFALL